MPAKKKFDKLTTNSDYSRENTQENTKDNSEISDANKPVRKYSFRPAKRKKVKKKVYTVGFIHVYIPFIAAFLLSVINRFLNLSGAYDKLDSTSYNILQCIIYVIIFIVPTLVYCKVRKTNVQRELSLHRFSFSYIPFMILSLALMLVVIAAEKIAIAYFFPEQTQMLNTNTLGVGTGIDVILSYAIFPAICQELLLRGLLQNEISAKAGGLSGIVVSSVAFALIHLDFRYFVVYLSAGFILAVCAHVTNSVIPSIILHILSNLFSLGFSARLSFIASERTGNVFLMIILMFFIFLLVLFFLKSIENICIKKAYLEDVARGAVKDSKGGQISRMYYRKPYTLFSSCGYSLHRFLRVVFSPALIIAAILFMFAVI